MSTRSVWCPGHQRRLRFGQSSRPKTRDLVARGGAKLTVRGRIRRGTARRQRVLQRDAPVREQALRTTACSGVAIPTTSCSSPTSGPRSRGSVGSNCRAARSSRRRSAASLALILIVCGDLLPSMSIGLARGSASASIVATAADPGAAELAAMPAPCGS